MDVTDGLTQNPDHHANGNGQTELLELTLKEPLRQAQHARQKSLPLNILELENCGELSQATQDE
jgi:hypothetical protein